MTFITRYGASAPVLQAVLWIVALILLVPVQGVWGLNDVDQPANTLLALYTGVNSTIAGWLITAAGVLGGVAVVWLAQRAPKGAGQAWMLWFTGGSASLLLILDGVLRVATLGAIVQIYETQPTPAYTAYLAVGSLLLGVDRAAALLIGLWALATTLALRERLLASIAGFVGLVLGAISVVAVFFGASVIVVVALFPLWLITLSALLWESADA